jgi:FMN phosphatase YigB (HAD superfamily)
MIRLNDAQQPLWRRVLFLDWHGVCSTTRFWHSILSRRSHPYHEEVKTAADRLFGQQAVVERWMRGQAQSHDVVGEVDDIRLDRRANPDFLLRRLVADCQRMTMDGTVFEAVCEATVTWQVVIATDNMDCLTAVLHRRRDLRRVIHAVLSSSDIGVLKSEAPQAFFGAWLRDRGLDFDDAILVDDSLDNCRAFESCGGRALHVDCPEHAAQVVRSLAKRPL